MWYRQKPNKNKAQKGLPHPGRLFFITFSQLLFLFDRLYALLKGDSGNKIQFTYKQVRGAKTRAPLSWRVPQQLRPPLAGGPHPSRCSAKAQHRATFPKGKAMHRIILRHYFIKM